MKTIPYLNFDGDCAEAFRFYADVLDGTITGMLSHGDSPIADQVPPEWHDRILNVHLVADGVELMGCDTPPGTEAALSDTHLCLQVDSAGDVDRIFAALAAGGRVSMPVDRTFWAERFGMLVDRFGTPWMVNFEGAAAPTAAAVPEGGAQ